MKELLGESAITEETSHDLNVEKMKYKWGEIPEPVAESSSSSTSRLPPTVSTGQGMAVAAPPAPMDPSAPRLPPAEPQDLGMTDAASPGQSDPPYKVRRAWS